MNIVFLLHLAATLFMVGVIWFVQVVQYPLFDFLGGMSFPRYETAYVNLVTWVVAPPMLLEGLTGALLLWRRPERVSRMPVWVGFVLLLIIWGSTAFLQAPQHNILTFGFDEKAYRFLLSSNWVRTVAWSLRGMLMLWMTRNMMA